MIQLHPQFLTGPDGNQAVLLSLAEYEAVLERLEDIEDIEDARNAMDEPTVPWETVKAELGM